MAARGWGHISTAAAKPLFEAASHDYWTQRDIVDRVNEETLRLSPADVRRQVNVWRELLIAD